MSPLRHGRSSWSPQWRVASPPSSAPATPANRATTGPARSTLPASGSPRPCPGVVPASVGRQIEAGLPVYREFGPPDDPGLVFFLGRGLLEVSGHAAGPPG